MKTIDNILTYVLFNKSYYKVELKRRVNGSVITYISRRGNYVFNIPINPSLTNTDINRWIICRLNSNFLIH